MAAAHDLDKTAFIFKRTYSKRAIQNDLKRKHPTFALFSKPTEWGGANDYRYGVQDADPQGVGGTVAGAALNNTGGADGGGMKGNQFSVARKKRYGYGTIDGEAYHAALKGSNGALMQLLEPAVNGTLNEHEDTLAHALFRDGTGVRGTVSAVSTTLITLTRQDDVRWFKRGMMILGSASTSGSSPRNSGTQVAVTKVDYANSQITTASAISGLTAGDFLFRYSEDATSGTAPMDGMQSIIPATAGTFRSVDCTVDRERYAGWYLNTPSATAEDSITELLVRMMSYSNNASDYVCIMNQRHAANVCKRAGVKTVFNDGSKKKALLGFETFELATAAGTVTCMPDADCDLTDGWIVTPETWEIRGLEEQPHIYQDDNMKYLRVSGEDSQEYRTRSMGNTICYAPVRNGRFRLNAS